MKQYLLKHPWLLGLAIITLLMSAIVDVAFAFVIKDIIDKGTSAEALGPAIVFGLFFLLIAFVCSILRKYCEYTYVRHSLVTLKDDLFRGHMSQEVLEFRARNSGQYMAQMTNDMLLLEKDYILNLLEMIDNIFIFTISLTSVLVISLQITMGIMVLGFLPLVFPLIFRHKLKRTKDYYALRISKFTSKSKDLYGGYEVIKSHGVLTPMADQFHEDNQALEASKFKSLFLKSLVNNLSESFGQLMHLTTIGIGSYFVMVGDLSMGSLIAVLQLMGFIVGPAVQISDRVSQYQSIKGVVGQMEAYLCKRKPGQGREPVLTEALSLDRVSYSYDGKKDVLSQVTWTIEAGKKYLVIGKSGSGKSTLVKLLLKYYKDFRGSIQLDGQAIQSFEDHQWYGLVKVIQQEVFIFDDTIKENICLYQTYGDEAIMAVLKQVGLYEKVMALEEGIYSSLEEGGQTFSGGERQRIAMARTLIRQPQVLLLDEATSALDQRTTDQVEDLLLSLKDQTLVSISHKLKPATMAKYDQILVLDQGRLVSRGTYQEIRYHKAFQELVDHTAEVACGKGDGVD